MTAGTEAASRSAPWPRAVFDAAVLRGLEERARTEIQAAGRIRALAAGEHVYEASDRGGSFYVVASGGVSLLAVRRGDDEVSELRRAKPGDSFGEEATVGTSRRTTAVATEPSTVAEVPVHVFRRAVARSGRAEVADKLERTLRRSATRDLLGTISLTRDLPDADFDALLDAVRFHEVGRGDVIYREGDPADRLWLLADGLVQIQTDDGERLHVRAYIGRGDFFGDTELTSGTRTSSAVASGASVLLSIPARVMSELDRAHPDLLGRLRRIGDVRREMQQGIIGAAAQNHTQHAFRDLYRLQIARSLLVIDLETCVRCGHCAWACASVHGVARLVRRGDKMVAQLDDGVTTAPSTRATDDAPIDIASLAAPRSLLLPNSCQHCEHPACMVDCPTGAIGRDPEGDVFIREELCTGCGACAKACPWDNIQMSPRPADAPRPKGSPSADVAVKCDLCRTYERGPACVAACPTEAIARINPLEDIAELRGLWGPARAPSAEGLAPRAPSRSAAIPLLGAAVAASSLGGVGIVMHARDLWSPAAGPAWLFGVLTAAAMIGLLAYAAPKRGIARWMKWKPRGRKVARPTSMVKPHLDRHLALGILAVGLGLAHAPVAWSASVGRAAQLVFAITVGFGALTWAAYALLPRRLARLERTASLPEDLPQQERALIDRLYREVSGKSDLVKKIFERILLPYAKSYVGPIQLLLSGRTLREEERALRARIDGVLEGRGTSRLAGIGGLIRIVVELRAVPAQRWLSRALRAGLPLHIVTFAIASILVAVHVVGVVW